MTPHASRMWVIDPSLNHAEDQGVGVILEGWEGQARRFRPALDGDGPDPSCGYETDAIVLMGSAASVYEPLPWMERLRRWLDPLLRGEIERPLLGICFGHQLIAEMAGARVDWLEPSRAKRVGVEVTELSDSRLLEEGGSLRVVVSHRESVIDTPSGYRVTAARPGVPIDGLEHESLPIFSYQFHPEAREEFAGRVGIEAEKIDDRVRADSRRLLDAFVRRLKN